MGGAAAMSLSGVLLPVGHIIAGSIWAIFHILIITLQAFIFMMLTLIYLGQAHELTEILSFTQPFFNQESSWKTFSVSSLWLVV
jgi:hypothetical protein